MRYPYTHSANRVPNTRRCADTGPRNDAGHGLASGAGVRGVLGSKGGRRDGREPEALLNAAHMALLEAKKRRNTICACEGTAWQSAPSKVALFLPLGGTRDERSR
jgi:hypothetical protein